LPEMKIPPDGKYLSILWIIPLTDPLTSYSISKAAVAEKILYQVDEHRPSAGSVAIKALR